MDQIKELLEILSKTPEMALWGMGLYFLFILIKAASWIGALTLVAKQFVKRFFDWKDGKLEVERQKGEREAEEGLFKILKKESMDNIPREQVISFFTSVRAKYLTYVHRDDLEEAERIIKQIKLINGGSLRGYKVPEKK